VLPLARPNWPALPATMGGACTEAVRPNTVTRSTPGAILMNYVSNSVYIPHLYSLPMPLLQHNLVPAGSSTVHKKLMYRTTTHLQGKGTPPHHYSCPVTTYKLVHYGSQPPVRCLQNLRRQHPATLPRSHHPGGDATVRLTTARNMRRHVEGPGGGGRG
jgi:hypothetical protein